MNFYGRKYFYEIGFGFSIKGRKMCDFSPSSTTCKKLILRVLFNLFWVVFPPPSASPRFPLPPYLPTSVSFLFLQKQTKKQRKKAKKNKMASPILVFLNRCYTLAAVDFSLNKLSIHQLNIETCSLHLHKINFC